MFVIVHINNISIEERYFTKIESTLSLKRDIFKLTDYLLQDDYLSELEDKAYQSFNEFMLVKRDYKANYAVETGNKEKFLKARSIKDEAIREFCTNLISKKEGLIKQKSELEQKIPKIVKDKSETLIEKFINFVKNPKIQLKIFIENAKDSRYMRKKKSEVVNTLLAISETKKGIDPDNYYKRSQDIDEAQYQLCSGFENLNKTQAVYKADANNDQLKQELNDAKIEFEEILMNVNIKVVKFKSTVFKSIIELPIGEINSSIVKKKQIDLLQQDNENRSGNIAQLSEKELQNLKRELEDSGIKELLGSGVEFYEGNQLISTREQSKATRTRG